MKFSEGQLGRYFENILVTTSGAHTNIVSACGFAKYCPDPKQIYSLYSICGRADGFFFNNTCEHFCVQKCFCMRIVLFAVNL